MGTALGKLSESASSLKTSLQQGSSRTQDLVHTAQQLDTACNAFTLNHSGPRYSALTSPMMDDFADVLLLRLSVEEESRALCKWSSQMTEEVGRLRSGTLEGIELQEAAGTQSEEGEEADVQGGPVG